MPKGSLNEGAEQEYANINFSRDGERLAGISRGIDDKLFIWDMTLMSQLEGGQADLPSPCSFCSFDPATSKRLVTGGENGIFFWKIEQQGETNVMKRIEAAIPDADGLGGSGEDGFLSMVEESSKNDDGK